jgi:putative transposase
MARTVPRDTSKIRRQRYGEGHFHGITAWCHLHQPRLALEKDRDRFVRLLEEVRIKFRFEVAGYVVLPDHVQFLMTDPAIDSAERSVTMLQQRYSRRFHVSARSDEQVWEKRFADEHLWTPDSVAARIRAMHEAPVRLGLAATPTEWLWSSARDYAGETSGVVDLAPIPALL